jgi:hypothetical protein
LEISIGKYNIQNKKNKKYFAQQVELCCVVLHKTTHDAKMVQKNKLRNMVGKVGLEGYLGETSNTPHQTLSITLLGHLCDTYTKLCKL